MFIVSTSILLAFIFSCNHTSETTISAETNKSIQAIDTIFAGDRDTTILLNNGEALLKGHITAHKTKLKYTIPAWEGQTVTAIVKPLKKGGNVRIHQVRKPDGASDGPFGDSISYAIKSNGNFIFIISENLMAGGHYTGDFILHILVK